MGTKAKTPKTVKTATLSVASNSILVILKIIIGVMIGSIAIISEAVHSLVDLLAALIAFFAVKESAKPDDNAHPYGHGKFENISGTIEAVLIFIAAAWIIYEAVRKIVHPQPIGLPALGAAVMFFSAGVNFFVSQRLFKVSKETGSIALEADGWHLRTDVYTSLGVAAALAIMFILSFFTKSDIIHYIDPIAALIVATMIIKAAWNLTIKAGRDLFDVSLPKEEIAVIENVIRNTPQIAGYHDLKTRKAGVRCFAEFHILVDSKMNVLDSHEITRKLKKDIRRLFEDIYVTIHVEPCDKTCTEKCKKGCLL